MAIHITFLLPSSVFYFYLCEFPIAYFNYFRLIRVLHGWFCLISVFIFSLALPFEAISISSYSFLSSFSVSFSTQRWTSVLQFICYGIEFHLAVFLLHFWRHNVAYGQLICHVSYDTMQEIKLKASECKIAKSC